jgi:hypothetical protein
MSIPPGCLFFSTSSHSVLRVCLVSSRLVYPRHIRWISLDAFNRSRSCCLLRRSAAARAVASWVPGVVEDVAHGLDARPDRLIWRDFRELPVKVWCIMSMDNFRMFGGVKRIRNHKRYVPMFAVRPSNKIWRRRRADSQPPSLIRLRVWEPSNSLPPVELISYDADTLHSPTSRPLLLRMHDLYEWPIRWSRNGRNGRNGMGKY